MADRVAASERARTATASSRRRSTDDIQAGGAARANSFRAGGAAGWPPSGGRGVAGRPLSGRPVLQDRLGMGRIRTAARPICCCVRTDEEGEGFYLFIMYNIKGENRLTYI